MAAVTWLGAVYTQEGVDDDVYAWTLTGNWNTKAVPGSADDVTIASGVPGPVLQATADIHSLIVDSKQSVTVGLDNSLGGQTYLPGTLTIAQNVTLNGSLGLDDHSEDAGGSTLSVGGALNIGTSGTLAIGNDLQAKATTATVGSISNAGVVVIAGYAGSAGPPVKPPVLAELVVKTAAGFGGQAGVLTGTVQLGVGPGGGGGSGDALLDFTGGGVFSTIKGSLSLTGPRAYVASGTSTTSNSALSGALSIAAGGALALQDDVSISLPSLTNAGSVTVDVGFLAGAGSHLTVSGQLNDSGGSLSIGRSAFATGSSAPIVSVGSIVTTTSSTVSLDGDAKQKIAGTLDVGAQAGFGTAGVLTGTVNLADAALLDFKGGGEITTVAAGSNLEISGPDAFLASGTSTSSNSALTDLSSVAGQWIISGGTQIADAATLLKDTGNISVDTNFLGAAGSKITVAGTLDVTGSLTLGRGSLAKGTTSPIVSVAALDNTGTIGLDGDATQNIAGILDVGGQAGFGTAGALTGTVNLADAALLDFKGGGTINTIALGGTLAISSAKAFLASGTATTSNSALTGLSTIDGSLSLAGGAAITTSSALTIGDGTHGASLNLDTGGAGGSTLHLSGKLTINSFGSVTIGGGGMTASDTFTASALANGGSITLNGNANGSVVGVLDIAAAAGFGTAGVLTGTVDLNADALLDFIGGGTINTIALGGTLAISSAKAFLASGTATTSNSALTSLATIDGSLSLAGGTAITTNGALTIGDGTHGASLNLDTGGAGGSSLHLSGKLTINSFGSVTIGGGGMTASDTFTASALANGGSITLNGNANGSVVGVLDIAAAAGFGTAGVLTGTVDLNADALLDFTGGGTITTIAIGGTLSISGSRAFLASGTSTKSNSALTGLSTIDGSLSLAGGAAITTSGALTIGGGTHGASLNVDTGGAGGSSLHVSGKLTINSFGSVTIGGGGMTASDTFTASALANGGSITLNGNANGSVAGVLDIAAAAGFGTTGVLTGTVDLNADALIDFTGGGTINTIATGGTLSVSGSKAFLASGTATTSNSALTGLATIDGSLSLAGGAAMTTSGALTVGDGTHGASLNVDTGGAGGSTLHVSGKLTINSFGSVTIGGGGMTASDTFTASALANGGSITLNGNANGSVVGVLDIAAAAGFGTAGLLTGTVDLNADALIDFTGGGTITTIAIGGTLSISGSRAFLASGTSTKSNSALTGLTTVDGALSLLGGAAVTTNSALTVGDGTHGASLNVDTAGAGGSSLSVTGSLTLDAMASLSIGNSGDSAKSTLKAASIAINGGSLTVAVGAEVSGAISFTSKGGTLDLIGQTAGPSVTGSNGVVDLTGSQVKLSGGGDTINFSGGSGDLAALSGTGSKGDVVNGSNGTIDLSTATAKVNGSSDTLAFTGNDIVTANGQSDIFALGVALGTSTIGGFNSTDTIELSHLDFANWNALQTHITQSGDNTLITYDKNDVLTLTDVTASSLKASAFKFI